MRLCPDVGQRAPHDCFDWDRDVTVPRSPVAEIPYFDHPHRASVVNLYENAVASFVSDEALPRTTELDVEDVTDFVVTNLHCDHSTLPIAGSSGVR